MTPTQHYALRNHLRTILVRVRARDEALREDAATALTHDEQAAQWAYDAWAQCLPLPDTNRWRDQD